MTAISARKTGRLVSVAALTVLALITAISNPPANAATNATHLQRSAQSAPRIAYVVNFLDNTVTPINTRTNTAQPPIKVGKGPNDVAITPNGAKLFVTDSAGNAVTPIRTATNTAGPRIKVGKYPTSVAITPDGKTAYVANAESNTVTPIHVATNHAGAPIDVGKGPSYVAITPDGATAYVVNLISNSVTPINTATNKAGAPIKVGRAPSKIAITPNGRFAYVINSYVHATTVTPIRIATNHALQPIRVGKAPDDIVITPNGKKAYVCGYDIDSAPPGGQGFGYVRPIRLATRTAGRKISLGHEFPDHLVASPDSSTVYVTSGAGVTPIDVATNTASQPIPTGSGPWTMAITPNGRRGYVTDNGTGSQPASTVTVLNLRTRTRLATIQVGLRPIAVVLTP